MASEYGTRPTELLGLQSRPAMERFRVDWDVFAATQAFRKDRQDAEQKAANSPGSASASERNELVEQKDARARRRQDMAEAGQHAGDLGAQADALADLTGEH